MLQHRRGRSCPHRATLYSQDGRVDSSRYMEYRLRSDFARRKLNRRRAAVGCLVAHTGIAVDQIVDDDLTEIEVERFSPADEERETPRFFERDRPSSVGETCRRANHALMAAPSIRLG